MPIANSKLDELIRTAKENLPRVDEDLLRKAHDFAFIAHEKDTRASGEPYFTHPFAVAKILAEEIPFDDISIVCGFLHDVVEDIEGYEIDSIRKNFGDEIAVIVDGLTKIKALFRGSNINQAENYRKLLMSITKDIRVIIVKFADRLHNMRELGFLPPDKRKRIAKETIEIFAPLAHRFGLGKIKWELEDLAFRELNKNAYDEIKKKLNISRVDRDQYIKSFCEPITKKLDEYGYRYELSGRPKHLYSIYRKMIKQSKPFEEIYDLSAIRIILDTEDVNECYTTLGIVNGIYIPIPDRFKDYIAIPKTNNYRSLHTTVIGPTGQRVEVQIRTRKMHEIAEQGVAAHWKYKEGKVHIDETITQYVQWIREILDNTGNEELKRTIVDNFRLDLYSDEVYVFTPKGDLKRLPIKSTPVDFAFAIHSDVGHHCIGAKVNKRIVPLDTKLNRGDQVEILTSKNQHPNKNWLKFVQTHKANSEIRKYLNKEDENLVESGKDIFNKKAKKLKVSLSSQDIDKLAKQLKFENSRIFYRALAQGTFNVDDAFIQQKKIQQEENTKAPEEEIEVFTRQARSEGGELIIDGEQFKVLISYSKCCNPIPGDPVAGYITTGEGIKIHRKDCKTLIEIAKREPEKIVSVQWPQMDDSSFLVGLHINGEDRAGMLNEIANSIVSYDNTSIKSINIDTAESIFNGIVTLYVNNLEHLSKITDRLKKIKGIFSVKRLESN